MQSLHVLIDSSCICRSSVARKERYAEVWQQPCPSLPSLQDGKCLWCVTHAEPFEAGRGRSGSPPPAGCASHQPSLRSAITHTHTHTRARTHTHTHARMRAHIPISHSVANGCDSVALSLSLWVGAPHSLAWVLEADVARLIAPAVLIAARRWLELRRRVVPGAAAVTEQAVFRPFFVAA